MKFFQGVKMNNYRIIYSSRKTLALEVTKDLEIIVRAPNRCSTRVIEEFVKAHEKWIEKAKARVESRKQNVISLTSEQEKKLKALAKEILPKKVQYYSKITGLTPTALHITSAKTRFGSCSGKNSISLSWRLMMYDEKAQDYVVLHELCHIKHHNHSDKFYTLIEKYMPDYKKRAELLKNPLENADTMW